MKQTALMRRSTVLILPSQFASCENSFLLFDPFKQGTTSCGVPCCLKVNNMA
jgi:hypothetical protein